MKLLLFALLSALCLLRIPAVVKVAEARASWVASVFGLAALYVLGTVTQLEVIDSYLGGINVTNLLQAIFALLPCTAARTCSRCCSPCSGPSICFGTRPRARMERSPRA